MAGSDDNEKTHAPTDKKLADARKRGEIANAPEMRHATVFVAALLVSGSVGAWTVSRFLAMFHVLWGHADNFALDGRGAQFFVSVLMGQIAYAIGPLFLVLMGFALLTPFLHGRPTLSWSRLKLKWNKLSPMAGMKRLFGAQGLVEFAKTLTKFALISSTVLLVIWPEAGAIQAMVGAPPEAIARTAATLVYDMIKAATLLVAALALIDLVYQRHAFFKKMRMSFQEIKDEHKQSEGDPKIKAKIRSIGMERAKRRMMAKVPEASVVITNPTHYAVALKYDHGAMAAPVVVAKGVDAVAFRIRDMAKEAGIPVIESPPLARALFASADLDRPIPPEHYSAVAEIIGYVMNLARRKR